MGGLHACRGDARSFGVARSLHCATHEILPAAQEGCVSLWAQRVPFAGVARMCGWEVSAGPSKWVHGLSVECRAHGPWCRVACRLCVARGTWHGLHMWVSSAPGGRSTTDWGLPIRRSACGPDQRSQAADTARSTPRY